MHIRTAATADSRALARLDASAWAPEVQVFPPNDADAPFFDNRRGPEDVIVAVDGDSIAGYAHLARHIPIPKNDHVLHLNALVVAPGQRGRGISHQLLDAAINEARRRGARKLGLRALSTNTASLWKGSSGRSSCSRTAAGPTTFGWPSSLTKRWSANRKLRSLAGSRRRTVPAFPDPPLARP